MNAKKNSRIYLPSLLYSASERARTATETGLLMMRLGASVAHVTLVSIKLHG